jgi:hypothetical protein
MVVEVGSREEAVRILPAGLRQGAEIIKLRKFTREEDSDSAVQKHNQENG